jgi:hypothetical protein
MAIAIASPSLIIITGRVVGSSPPKMQSPSNLSPDEIIVEPLHLDMDIPSSL